MTDPIALPAGFAVTTEGGGGRSRGELRRLALSSPSRGLRVRPDADDPYVATAQATLAGIRPGSVACGVTAARLWQLPLPPWLALHDDVPVEVAARPDGSHTDRPNVRGRRLVLPDTHVSTIGDLAVTTPARTWLDCAADLPLEYVVAMGDHVLRRRQATERELDAVVHWAFRRRGVAVARQARAMLDARAESPGESRMRALLLAGGVPRPECNYDVVENGGWLARADLAWPAFRVLVEYDGLVHADEDQRRKDARRRNVLQDAGWLVIVVTADDLRRPWLLSAMVLRALHDRGYRPPR